MDVLLHTGRAHELALDAVAGHGDPRATSWGCGTGFDDLSLPALGIRSNGLQIVGSAHNASSTSSRRSASWLSSPSDVEGTMPTITTSDGVEIFYKDWGAASRSCSTTAGR